MRDGKYRALAAHLHQANRPLTISFSDIEEQILSFPLPTSARKFRPWWSNDLGHSQARSGWLAAGFRVAGVRMEHEEVDFVLQGQEPPTARNAQHASRGGLTGHQFEAAVRPVVEDYYGIPLNPGTVPDVPKLFDFRSPDGAVLGDAKNYSLVRGKALPPAKFSVIAEHVWLLQQSKAKHRFLVFGNDIRVPMAWLEKYGHLASGVDFLFWNGSELSELTTTGEDDA